MNAHRHRRAARIGKMQPWLRRAIYVVLGLCALSGLIWFWLREISTAEPFAGDRWILVAHGVTGMLAAMALGSVLAAHIQVTWRHHRNRVAGALTTALFGLLVVSALLLYYGTEDTHLPAKWLHIGIGLAIVLAFPLHVVLGRRAIGRMPEHHHHDARHEPTRHP